MLEPRDDQAQGLRRLFGGGGVRVLPITSVGEDSAPFVAHLAAALSRLGQRTLVLDADRGRIAPAVQLRARHDLLHLLAGERTLDEVVLRSPEGFGVLPAHRGLDEFVRADGDVDALFGAFAALPRPFDVLLVTAPPETLAGVLGRRTAEAALVCGTDPREVAGAYSRIKAMHTLHGFERFHVAFHRVGSPADAAASHERLARTASRFLQARVDFLGAIERDELLLRAERARSSIFAVASRSDAARAFERIALQALEWPLARFGRHGGPLH